MSYNPNSLKNLEKGQKFTPGDSRIQSGKIAGTRNMKTVLLNWLDVEAECTDPVGNSVQLPLIDKVALAIINKACQGNVSAANFVSGCAFGKMDDLVVTQPEKQSINWSVYNEEELKILTALITKGIQDNQATLS